MRYVLAVVFTLSLSGQTLQMVEVSRGYAAPVDLQFPNDNSGRLFVVEQGGRILVTGPSFTSPTVFLDISSRVASGADRGLLGLAFPPRFAQKQYFYVSYANTNGVLTVARYNVSASNANMADPNSQQLILTTGQSAALRLGGQIAFGPDGFLYIGSGDGNDRNQAQNLRSLLGKILRIDTESGTTPYAIPIANPFVITPNSRPEIWAFGLRNPGKFSFDRLTRDLWIADSGAGQFQEIDLQPAISAGGTNYGWPLMDGNLCLSADGCGQAPLTLPVWAYAPTAGDQSITGGFVYRGSLYPNDHFYHFADLVSGRIWNLSPGSPGGGAGIGGPQPSGPYVSELRDTDLAISTFGQDANGEMYVADFAGGMIYRIGVPAVGDAATFTSLSPGAPTVLRGSGFTDSNDIAQAAGTPLPTTLGGVQVLVNGNAAPLFSVASDQILFQMPLDVPGAPSAHFVVKRGDAALFEITGNVFPYQPAIYSRDGIAIVVHNSDYTLADAGHPAERGEYVFFYALGLGPVAGGPPTGSPAPLDRLAPTVLLPEVKIDGVPCEVAFAGLAPGMVGIYQVNIRIPDGAPSGDHELVIVANHFSSQPARLLIR